MNKIIVVIVTMLIVIASLKAQDQIVNIGTKGASFDDTLISILADADTYNGKIIQIEKAIFYPFGFQYKVIGFYHPNSWFSKPNTYAMKLTNRDISLGFSAFFSPESTDIAAKKWCLELTDKVYRSPKNITLKGKFVVHNGQPLGVQNILLVSQIIIDNQVYNGTLPTTITE